MDRELIEKISSVQSYLTHDIVEFSKKEDISIQKTLNIILKCCNTIVEVNTLEESGKLVKISLGILLLSGLLKVTIEEVLSTTEQAIKYSDLVNSGVSHNEAYERVSDGRY